MVIKTQYSSRIRLGMLKEMIIHTVERVMSNSEELKLQLLQSFQNNEIKHVLAIVQKLNSADTALVLSQLALDQQVKWLQQLPHAAMIMEYLTLTDQLNIVKQMSLQSVLTIVDQMHSNHRVDLVKVLPDEYKHYIDAHLSPEKQQQMNHLVSYDEESAGAIMTSDYVTLSADLTMQQAIDQLRVVAAHHETLYLIYITNLEHQLQGVISLRQIIQAKPNSQIRDHMTTQVVTGHVDDDQEIIARKLSHYDFIALPIVDEQHHLLGIVTYDDAMDVLQEEYTEDVLKSAAVESTPHLSLKTAPIFLLYRKRVFWLVFLVFGSLLSGLGIAHFEGVISSHIVLVFFLPLLVGSGGNAGSQSSTLMVRAIATGDVKLSDWFKLLGRESLVALSLGITMAFAVSILGYIRGDLMVAVVLAMSMVAIVLMGSLIGMSLPFILNRMGLDPASASGPLVTSICDATGVVVYLFIASQLLIL